MTAHKEITAWRKPYFVEYLKGKYSRARAWDRAKNRPPIVRWQPIWSGPSYLFVPRDKPKYTGYRKAHTATHWRWEIVDWDLFELSPKGQAMLKELKMQLAYRLLWWML